MGCSAFFYAYVASRINGLSTMDGADAIAAMNAINGAIRNAQFFPFFFLTPLVCVIAGLLAWGAGRRRAASFLIAADVTYALGGIGLTMFYNVPLNENLMLIGQETFTKTDATQIWNDYARDWSFWNLVRTVFSGIALLFVGSALAAK